MTVRVALLKSRFLHVGGQEKYAQRIARGFAQAGCEVFVLTSDADRVNPFGFEIVDLCRTSSFTPLNVLKFDAVCQEWLRRHPVDIVFGMDRNRFQTHYRAGNGVHAAYLARRSQTESWLKKLSFQVNPQHRLLLSYEKRAFEHPELKLLFTNSEMVRQEVLSYYRIPPQNVVTVHNGVEWTELGPPFTHWHADRQNLMLSLELDPACYQFLFVGNGFRRKGLLNVLYALTRMPKDSCQLSVVGEDKESAWFAYQAERLGVAPMVRFFGKQLRTAPFYQIADALVLPSLYDPFSNVTVEALAMGLHVITSHANGGHEIIQNALAGTVLEDLSSLPGAMLAALHKPKTVQSATAIRQTVRHLDFQNQIATIVQASLKT